MFFSYNEHFEFGKYFLIHSEEENFSTSSKSTVIAQMPLTERKERPGTKLCELI